MLFGIKKSSCEHRLASFVLGPVCKGVSVLLMAAFLAVSCGGDEPVEPTPTTPPTPPKDTNAPVITVSQNTVNVIAAPEATVSGSELKVGTASVATWKDDVSASCTVEVSLTPTTGIAKAVKTWDKLSEEGKLQLKVIDEAGNAATAEIKLTREDSQAPTVSVVIPEKNVIAGVTITVEDNQLLFNEDVAASWKDDYTETCNIQLTMVSGDGSEKTVNPGDALSDAGTLKITVSDEFQNAATAEIALTAVAVYGLENLSQLQLKVDQEVSLLKDLTYAEGITLQKVEIVQDGVRTVIDNPNAFIPEYPGGIELVLTLSRPDGSTLEVEINDLIIKALVFQAISRERIKAEEVFPQLTQIEAGDKNIYEYVKDLWIAESFAMAETMETYGGGWENWNKYSGPEIQNMISNRLVLGLRGEVGAGYEEREWIWPKADRVYIGDHWKMCFELLCSFNSKYTTVKNLSDWGVGWAWNLLEAAQNNPNTLFIFSASISPEYDNKTEYEQKICTQDAIDLYDCSNVAFFQSWGDTETINWVPIKKLYNGICESNWDWIYTNGSVGNSDQNNYPNSNMRIGIWTNRTRNVDMTDSQGSLVPIGFANNTVVTAQPQLPYHNPEWKLTGQLLPKNWSYTSSEMAPTIASNLYLMFRNYPDVKDARTLLKMAESSAIETTTTLNWVTYTFIEYSLKNFCEKYLMPNDLAITVGLDETIRLNKGYYPANAFTIPGCEVEIDGEWIPCDERYKDRILTENPATLNYRINGRLLRKYGYKSGDAVEGSVESIAQVGTTGRWESTGFSQPVRITVR